jgi:hypothetical protein
MQADRKEVKSDVLQKSILTEDDKAFLRDRGFKPRDVMISDETRDK